MDTTRMDLQGYFVAILDGKLAMDINSYLTEMGRIFNFPSYYGHNINALWDCIGDLSWISEKNYALIIKNSSQFMSKELPNVKKEMLDLLNEIALDWKNVPNYKDEDKLRKRSEFQIFFE